MKPGACGCWFILLLFPFFLLFLCFSTCTTTLKIFHHWKDQIFQLLEELVFFSFQPFILSEMFHYSWDFILNLIPLIPMQWPVDLFGDGVSLLYNAKDIKDIIPPSLLFHLSLSSSPFSQCSLSLLSPFNFQSINLIFQFLTVLKYIFWHFNQ